MVRPDSNLLGLENTMRRIVRGWVWMIGCMGSAPGAGGRGGTHR